MLKISNHFNEFSNFPLHSLTLSYLSSKFHYFHIFTQSPTCLGNTSKVAFRVVNIFIKTGYIRVVAPSMSSYRPMHTLSSRQAVGTKQLGTLIGLASIEKWIRIPTIVTDPWCFRFYAQISDYIDHFKHDLRFYALASKGISYSISGKLVSIVAWRSDESHLFRFTPDIDVWKSHFVLFCVLVPICC